MIHIVTGEYPPMDGGVSDYSALLASELALRGEQVHVWAPALDRIATRGVSVHRVEEGFLPAALIRLNASLDRMPQPRRLLVQWTPHAFGMRSLNVPFAAWLWKRAHVNHDRVEVMVHEAFLAFGEGSWRQNIAAAVHRLMIVLLMDAAAKVWISIPAWEGLLRPWCLRDPKAFEWLPVPCNVEQDVDASKVSRLRSKLAPEGQPLAGHFGTYRPDIERLLTPALLALLSRTNANVLLAGHGSDHYHAWFTASFPAYQERVITTGTLPAFKLADTLSACDVLIEPYPDGISTRRGSAMTALALGLPVVTNLGRLSESLWTEGAVAIAESAAPDQIAGETLRLLADSERRIAISVHALELYHLRFDIRHTVAALLREPSPSRLRLAKVIA